MKGCDGSVLIQQPKSGDGPDPENRNPNHAGLRGFDVIDRAKAQLEAQCPGVVSCADIVALAARDSVVLVQILNKLHYEFVWSTWIWSVAECVSCLASMQSRGPFYQVPTGRMDGLVSNAADAVNMPDLPEPIEVIKAKFAEKGLSEKDLVLLSG